MKSWEETLISPNVTILETIKVIDTSSLQIALVVDDEKRLVGVVTDGDIRRGFLKAVPLSRSVESIMNRKFITVNKGTSSDETLLIMQQRDLRQIPVLDEQGRVVDLKVLKDMLRVSNHRDNWVVLMAGGIGTRLQPLTNDCPKPLLPIGDQPVLETILKNFIKYGFEIFYISVNYKADMIEKYFGDGSRWNVDIKYLRERKHLGTAGALSLLPEKPTDSLIVMNGDVLTKVNMQHLLDFHIAQKSKATMCVKDYHLQIPYGVAQIHQHRLINIDEKPVHHFFVNAGIYVLEPDILDFIPSQSFFDMTSLFKQVIEKKKETTVFPIREYWIDIGRERDYNQANGDFTEVFG